MMRVHWRIGTDENMTHFVVWKKKKKKNFSFLYYETDLLSFGDLSVRVTWISSSLTVNAQNTCFINVCVREL